MKKKTFFSATVAFSLLRLSLASDPYAYMHNREDERVNEVIQEENRHFEGELSHLKSLRFQLYRELSSVSPSESLDTLPYQREGALYYTNEESGFTTVCRNDGEEVLNEGEFDSERLINYVPSPDGRYIAFIYDKDASGKHYLGIRDLKTKYTDFSTGLSHMDAGVFWTRDSNGILYVQRDATERGFQLCMLNLKTWKSTVLLQENDPSYRIEVEPSHDQSLFFVYLTKPMNNEVYILSAKSVNEPLNLFASRGKGKELRLEKKDDDHFYVLSNRDERVIPFADYVVYVKHRAGLPIVEVVEKASGLTKSIPFEEPVYAIEMRDNYDFNAATLRFAYWSPKTPPTLYDYHFQSGKMEMLGQELPSKTFNSDLYVTERLTAEAPDGTKVPISLVRRRDMTAPAPLVLWGYGSYGVSEDRFFSNEVLALVNRGVTFCWAHVRGGGELGSHWYDQGRMLNKKNTFTDFIACARHLCDQKYTTPDQMAIWGRSAGGMLVAAVLNQEPNLCQAAIADVPFVDVMNTMMDPSIPWTTQEYAEWGNPLICAYYLYMKSYCPYSNVKRQGYPALLLTGGMQDPLVSYAEPLKLTAKLREMKTDTNPLLLHIDWVGGHSESLNKEAQTWITAGKLAFLLDQLRPQRVQSEP